MAFEFDYYKTIVEAKATADRLQQIMNRNIPAVETTQSATNFIDTVSMEANISRVEGPLPMYNTKEEAIAAAATKIPIQVYYFEKNVMLKMGLE